MLPDKRIPTHPGEMLLLEFLKPLGMSQVDFADHLGIPIQRVNEIVKGKRGVTPETAWLFSQALGTSPEFWTNLQAAHDLAKARPERSLVRLSRGQDERPRAVAARTAPNNRIGKAK
jgi:antitoxin HigA-1